MIDLVTLGLVKKIIKNSLGGAGDFSFKKVDVLPAQGEGKYVYLVPKNDGTGNDNFNEYIWFEGKFEPIGSTSIGGVQSDWAENNPQSPAYVKNRPGGYEKITGETVLYPEQATEFPLADGVNVAAITLSSRLQKNDKLIVKFDSKEYVCEARENSLTPGVLLVGNLGPYGLGDDTGEPFLIQDSESLNATAAASWAEGTTHNFAIKKVNIEIVKIPEKFLPEMKNVIFVSPLDMWTDAAWKVYGDTFNRGVTVFGMKGEIFLRIDFARKIALYTSFNRINNNTDEVYLALYQNGTETRFPISGAQSDWSINDPGDPAYVKNRPGGYEKITDKIFINNETLPGDGVPVTIPESLPDGSKCTVIFDGTTYDCEKKKYVDSPMWGNASYIGFDDQHDFPFLFVFTEDGTGTIYLAVDGMEHTLTVKASVLSSISIPSKYFPAEIYTRIVDDPVGWSVSMWDEYYTDYHKGRRIVILSQDTLYNVLTFDKRDKRFENDNVVYNLAISTPMGEVMRINSLGVIDRSIIIQSSTPDSYKRFAITVDDTGTIKATEVV